jgi:hypothetical protein
MMAECRKEGPVRDALLFGSAGMTTSLIYLLLHLLLLLRLQL